MAREGVGTSEVIWSAWPWRCQGLVAPRGRGG